MTGPQVFSPATIIFDDLVHSTTVSAAHWARRLAVSMSPPVLRATVPSAYTYGAQASMSLRADDDGSSRYGAASFHDVAAALRDITRRHFPHDIAAARCDITRRHLPHDVADDVRNVISILTSRLQVATWRGVISL